MKAEEIKFLRIKLRLTQREFAARLKIDAKTVSWWERGINRPGVTSLRKLKRLEKKGEMQNGGER